MDTHFFVLYSPACSKICTGFNKKKKKNTNLTKIFIFTVHKWKTSIWCEPLDRGPVFNIIFNIVRVLKAYSKYTIHKIEFVIHEFSVDKFKIIF